MKSMLAVTQLISKQKLRKIDVLTEDVLNAKNSKFRELYLGLRDGTIKTDREAAKRLYDAGPSDSRYRQLKSRFRKRLLNTLFFVDQSRPHRSSFDQTYHNCQRDWSLINILRVNGAEEPALQMTRSLLTVCQNFGFAELTVQSARYLANHAATTGDVKGAAQFQELIDRANQTYQFELQSESILRKARLLYHATHPDSNPTEVEHEVEVLQKEIDQTVVTSQSAMIFYNHIETSCILSRTVNDKSHVIALVDEAVAYSMVSPRQMQETRVWSLRMWQIEAYIEKRDHERGLAALRQLETKCTSGSPDWFNVQKPRVSLLLCTGNTREALQVIDAVQLHRNFKRLPAQEVEGFRLLELLAICTDVKAGTALPRGHKTTIEGFLRKDATFGGEFQRLNAWRYLLKAALQFKLGMLSELSDTIADLRHLSVKRLDTKKDCRLIAISQLLYRLERKQFRGDLDRVGERYYHRLKMAEFQCSLRTDSFNPIDVEDMLAFFGVNEFATLPA